MPNSGSRGSNGKSRKAGKNTIPFPPTGQGDSNNSSKLLEKPIPNPDEKPRYEVALRRLRVKPEDLESSPQITPVLRRTVGSVAKSISLLRFSEDPQAQKIVESYDQANKCDRDIVPIEAFCLRTNVNPAAILGLVIMSMRNLSAQESALTTMMEHPEVVRSTIQFAKEIPGASKDREMIHQAVGYLPTSKGSSIIVNLPGANPQFNQAADDEDDDDSSFRLAFESEQNEIEGWSNSRRRLLEAGK